MTKVLVVDDEPQIRRALSLNLSARGYEVVQAASGELAIAASANDRPDIVLLDLGLPGVDGATVIEAVRGWTNVPVIVLTVRDDEPSKVRLLDAGADDYVTKPFGIAELVARMRAILRRAGARAETAAQIVTESFTIDLGAHRAFAGKPSAEVRLTPIEWSIVTFLARHPNRLITYRQLLDHVWGPSYDPDSNLMRVHMGNIRRKLEDDPARPQHFMTDAGVGFRFQIDEAVGNRSDRTGEAR